MNIQRIINAPTTGRSLPGMLSNVCQSFVFSSFAFFLYRFHSYIPLAYCAYSAPTKRLGFLCSLSSSLRTHPSFFSSHLSAWRLVPSLTKLFWRIRPILPLCFASFNKYSLYTVSPNIPPLQFERGVQ